ncbi:FliH/SctL family protein [Devosia sp. ZB163]|uniref:FliH/SctL family protein n=1 Tax=Devosia sp. ZB163 TaxID=3025938 RepID=UPI0023608FBA|nr:FliH/SctL family protein [Devosia sp. ZB163]MDC9825213.1 FliH/SctL family protein [Devosia sp. ZB163]
MTASPARFTFDLDLGRNEDSHSMVPETAMVELLAAARAEGVAAGRAEGERTALANAAKAQAAAAEALGSRVAAMAAAMDDARKQAVADGVELSLSIARKLAGGLIAREPTVEIETLVAECMATLDGVPHLVIRCEPMLADAVRDIATGKMTTSGFTGRLVVLGDPDVAIGDARIEWADGGVVRDIRKLSTEIDLKIAEYFAARGIRNQETEQ